MDVEAGPSVETGEDPPQGYAQQVRHGSCPGLVARHGGFLGRGDGDGSEREDGGRAHDGGPPHFCLRAAA
ncbi:hypothetical protein BN2537_3879 [Streptomyces venezuelae]|nr:hypothetical protein BN2537_3879 [Streptomyces venezuelae]